MHGHWWVWPYPGIGPIVYEDVCFEPLVLSGHPLTHILVLSQLKLLHMWCVHVWCVHVWMGIRFKCASQCKSGVGGMRLHAQALM